VARSVAPDTEFREARVNGEPGYLFVTNGVITTTLSFDVADGEIVGVTAVLNPDKLLGLKRRLT
jgi:RNA polymerase sigma-70 factor (ECF subfamily)